MVNIKQNLRQLTSKVNLGIEVEEKEGFLNLSESFREALSKAINSVETLSRYDIASQTSKFIMRDITKNMLDKYTSPSNTECRFGAEELTSFCYVADTIEPFNVLLAPLQCRVLTPQEAAEFDLFKLKKQRNEIDQQIDELEKRVNGHE